MTRTGVRPVLVTGATGRVGRAVVDLLVEAGVPVRALTRSGEAAALPPDVDVVTGDLTVPESLDAGLRGVGAVFLVWTAPAATAPAVIQRLAATAGRVVFLSSPHQTPHPFFRQPNPMAELHADIERLIAAANVESTILRPGMFASNALFWWAPAIRAGDAVRWPYGAAETAPVDDRDVAAVAARTLYEDGYAGGDYVLTGPESLSQAEQVSIIGDVLGRRIRFEELSPEEFRSETEGSWPRPVVDMLLAAWGATLGRPAFVTTTVSEILASPPRSFRQWVADHAAAFTELPGAGAAAANGRRRLVPVRGGEPSPEEFQHVVEHVLGDLPARGPLGPAHADEVADAGVGVGDDLRVVTRVYLAGELRGAYTAPVAPGEVLVVLTEQSGCDELRLAYDAVHPRTLRHHLEVDAEAFALPRSLTAVRLLQGRLHGHPQVRVDPPDDRGEDFRLGLEVRVEAARGHPGPGADVGDRGAAVTALAEKFLGGRQQTLCWRPLVGCHAMLVRDQGEGMPLAGAGCWVAVKVVIGPDAVVSVVRSGPC